MATSVPLAVSVGQVAFKPAGNVGAVEKVMPPFGFAFVLMSLTATLRFFAGGFFVGMAVSRMRVVDAWPPVRRRRASC